MLKKLELTVDLLALTRRTLRQALEGLTPAQLELKMPGEDWSIKDALAHLAGNEALMLRALESIVVGSTQSEQGFDNEAQNRAQVERGRTLTLAQIWQELDANRRRLLDFLNGLTPEQIERRGTHPYQGMMTVREFLGIIYSHEQTHVREMVEWARRLRAGDGGKA